MVYAAILAGGKGKRFWPASTAGKPKLFLDITGEGSMLFLTWKQVDDLASFKENLDAALWEHLDSLSNKNILATQIEKRYNKYVLRLREEYLRGLVRKRAAALTLEAETGGTAAELAKLKEQGIEVSTELREVFTQKARRGQG